MTEIIAGTKTEFSIDPAILEYVGRNAFQARIFPIPAKGSRTIKLAYTQVVTPRGHSTLVSFRPPGDPVELVAQLYEVGVVVRELPGRNLVRASCGWWTNEDDLQRLVAGLRG